MTSSPARRAAVEQTQECAAHAQEPPKKIVAGAVALVLLGGAPVAISAATPDAEVEQGTGRAVQEQPTPGTSEQGTAPIADDGSAAGGTDAYPPVEEVLQPLYDEADGHLVMDEHGNWYGEDGALVRDEHGTCVQGLTPGSAPEANVCFDPSLVPDMSDLPGVEVTWDVTVGQ
jgi:hypothetical protein